MKGIGYAFHLRVWLGKSPGGREADGPAFAQACLQKHCLCEGRPVTLPAPRPFRKPGPALAGLKKKWPARPE
ncbi:unnamed protein product [Caenorhabditis auriculariae]|uniref:Uncharacterized protein n=1 Tax=Caenorhabditis auriculariae TaxID=2777116 RepID=A0A8S1HC14_9PELO|nr:unnamed protein product [Caenorhabditis auriculariae]